MIMKFLILFFPLFIFYVLISYIFFTEYFYMHPNLLFFAEKALIAIQTGLRLENIGFVYPPFAFIPFLFYNNLYFVPSFVSALLTTFLIIFLLKECQNSHIILLPIVFVFLNPLYLFLATQRFDVLMFYIVLTISVIYVIKYLIAGYSLYIFISGILLGLIFFIDFRSVFIVPLYVLSIFFSTKNKGISYKLAITTVIITPIFFFLLSWFYLNWAFTGNPLDFIENPYSYFRNEHIPEEFTIASGTLIGSLILTIKQLIINFPLIIPYFVQFLFIRKFKLLFGVPFYLMYILPVFLLYFSIYYGIFFPFMHTAVLFQLFSIFFSCRMRTIESYPVIISFLISFFFTFLLPLYSKDLNEKFFVGTFLGKTIEDINLKDDLKTSQVIKSSKCELILTDDAYTFPVIYFSKNINNFILPHNSIFFTSLSNPALFADCLLISRNSKDFLNKRFPKAQHGFVSGFYLQYSSSKYMLYIRYDKK